MQGRRSWSCSRVAPTRLRVAVERITSRQLRGFPWASCPSVAHVRRQRVLEADLEKYGAPAPAVVAPQLEVVLLARHPGHDVANPAPRLEVAVQQPQLGLARFDGEEAESGAEELGPLIVREAHCRSLSKRAHGAIPRPPLRASMRFKRCER